jgi:2,3-dihydroxy-p-cumate/2,3-dihydroxybenzoate 3,4-dioxygenase
MNPMIFLRDIRYVRLGTRDLDSAARFARDILGLEPAGCDTGARYFRSDSRDHTLVLLKGDPRDHATAFELESQAALDAAGEALEGLRRDVKWGTKDGCAQRRVEAFLSFKDPSGNQIELVVRPHHSGKEYFPQRAAGITGFSHIGLRTTDPVRDEAFWTQVMNARVSDRIGAAPLLRIDEVHHRMALFPSTHPGVQHVNHQVRGIDDIMRSYYFLKEQGVKIVFGPGRHPTSGAMFLYFEGPDGMVYEYSSGVRLIRPEEEAGYRPRQFPFEPNSFCMWGSRPDIAEFREKPATSSEAA